MNQPKPRVRRKLQPDTAMLMQTQLDLVHRELSQVRTELHGTTRELEDARAEVRLLQAVLKPFLERLTGDGP